ncbi:MAG TPA: GNAT family N-acetyltransferase [Burkholderiales bacterium]|nr:GNAT family N-acetyltransferase [Burkholderiales bacterium]
MKAAAPTADLSPIDLQLRDGRRVTLRTVRPQDKDEFRAAFNRLSAESRYTRFMSALRELPPQMLKRATNPEESRELQLVAVVREGEREKIVGGARYAAGEGSTDCEFAVAVADEWQGLGLARQLLEALRRAARARGFKRMEGFILASNTRMLGLAKRLGFIEVASPEGPTVRMVRCDLTRIS